jgi:hypothetical protein
MSNSLDSFSKSFLMKKLKQIFSLEEMLSYFSQSSLISTGNIVENMEYFFKINGLDE